MPLRQSRLGLAFVLCISSACQRRSHWGARACSGGNRGHYLRGNFHRNFKRGYFHFAYSNIVKSACARPIVETNVQSNMGQITFSLDRMDGAFHYLVAGCHKRNRPTRSAEIFYMDPNAVAASQAMAVAVRRFFTFRTGVAGHSGGGRIRVNTSG